MPKGSLEMVLTNSSAELVDERRYRRVDGPLGEEVQKLKRDPEKDPAPGEKYFFDEDNTSKILILVEA